MSIMDRIKYFVKRLVGDDKFNAMYEPYYEKKIIRRMKEVDRINHKYSYMWGGYLPWLVDPAQILRSDGNKKSWTVRGTFYSQCGQDRFVSILFPDKTDGVFLDIGGNQPITINNTYYFEKIGWKGLAFEPIEGCRKLWDEQRKTRCLGIALGGEDKDIEIIEFGKDYLSHRSDISSGASYRATHDDVNSEESRVIDKRIVRQRILNDVLNEYDMHDIDYCSLDVEGLELEILESIDFEKNTIKCFTIENEDDWDSIFRIRRFMMNHGYWLIA